MVGRGQEGFDCLKRRREGRTFEIRRQPSERDTVANLASGQPVDVLSDSREAVVTAERWSAS